MEPDLADKLRYAEEKRQDDAGDYHDRLVEKDKLIDEKDVKIGKLEEKVQKGKKEHNDDLKRFEQLEQGAEKMQLQLAKLENNQQGLQTTMDEQRGMIAARDKEIERQKQRVQQLFQDKRKAEKELAETLATNIGLHKKVDELEKIIATKDKELHQHAENAEYINDVHFQLEDTFTEFKGGNLSTPELLEKIRERENSMLRRSDSRSSTTSKSDEKGVKKPRKSVAEEMAELFGEEEGENEDDDDEDVTLTEPIEVTELREKLQEIENELEDAKTKQRTYLNRVNELTKELEEKSKEFKKELKAKDDALDAKSAELEEKKRALENSSMELEETRRALKDSNSELEKKSRALDDSKMKQTKKPEELGISTISSVATEPVAPNPPTTTKKPEQQLGYSANTSVSTTPTAPTAPAPPTTNTITKEIYIHAQPGVRECWNAMPTWLFVLLSLFFVALAYYSWETYHERALWLGANGAAPRVFKVTKLAGSRVAGGYDSGTNWGLGFRLLREDVLGWSKTAFGGGI